MGGRGVRTSRVREGESVGRERKSDRKGGGKEGGFEGGVGGRGGVGKGEEEEKEGEGKEECWGEKRGHFPSEWEGISHFLVKNSQDSGERKRQHKTKTKTILDLSSFFNLTSF